LFEQMMRRRAELNANISKALSMREGAEKLLKVCGRLSNHHKNQNAILILPWGR
jgi:hypothetical protein